MKTNKIREYRITDGRVNVDPEKKIDFFDGTDYDFLSNFHPSPIVVDGEYYPTVEHAFQAAKMSCIGDFKRVRDAYGPAEAKALGRFLPMRKDWNEVKYDVMLKFVFAKFEQNADLAEKLLATGNAELVEGTLWNDRIWGIDIYSGKGTNLLGKILMEVREELKNNLK